MQNDTMDAAPSISQLETQNSDTTNKTEIESSEAKANRQSLISD
jgi:hypothetical protein